MTGYFQMTADFGGGTVTSAGLRDIFVATYAANNGSHRWSMRGGGADDETSQGVTVDAAGDVLAIGYFRGTANFGYGSITSAGSADVFLLCMTP